ERFHAASRQVGLGLFDQRGDAFVVPHLAVRDVVGEGDLVLDIDQQMEFIAKPLDDFADVAVVIAVLLAAAGRLGQTVGDFSLHPVGVGLGTGIQVGGIARGVPTQARYRTSQSACQIVKNVAEGGVMRLLAENVEETGDVVAVGDLILGGDADQAAQRRI